MEWMATLMGEASRQTHAATFPPDRFYCLLDELPLHLIPGRDLPSMPAQPRFDRPLILNPECRICAAGEQPEEMASQSGLLSGFALRGTIAWVRDMAGGALLPFWLGPRFEEAVRDLKPGERAPQSLGTEARRWLSVAGILKAADDDGNVRRTWEETVATHGLYFREKGYAPISGLIHPLHLAGLRRYYRYLIRTGAIKLGDGQSPRRYVAYNEPVARFFHHLLASKFSAVAGQPLKPSYVYMASYLAGAELRKHTDREQCEFSLTLCLDYSPEPAVETPWPIRLDTRTGQVTVYQALGDALAYRGTRLPHYRDTLGEGQTSTSIFFHYVPEDFLGSLD
jgi:hypothetical protein